ncbi:hypothetical protein ABTX60_01335 [Streptomyces sp. NPDC126510]
MIRLPGTPSSRLTHGTAVHPPRALQGHRHVRRPPGREAAA